MISWTESLVFSLFFFIKKINSGGTSMSEIKSNSVVAKSVASGIASSLDGINQKGTILSDNQTTVAGNTSAQQAISQLTTFNSSLSQAVGNASANIRSVAVEFEAVEDRIVQTILQQFTVK